PSGFTPIDPRPPARLATLSPLQLAEGDLNRGTAVLKLPFDVVISTTEASRDAGMSPQSLRYTHSKFEFPAGSSVMVSTEGVVRIGGDVRGREVPPSRAATQRDAGAHGVINVLAADLAL